MNKKTTLPCLYICCKRQPITKNCRYFFETEDSQYHLHNFALWSAGENLVQSFVLALLFSFCFNLDSLPIPQILETIFFLNTFNFLPLMLKLTATLVDDCSLLPVGYFSSYFLTPDQKVKIHQTSLQRKSPCQVFLAQKYAQIFFITHPLKCCFQVPPKFASLIRSPSNHILPVAPYTPLYCT